MKIFYSLLPHLQTERGHYFVYHKCVQQAVEKMNLHFHAFVSVKCQIELPKNWHRKFSKFSQKKLRYFNPFLRLINYFQLFTNKENKNSERIFFLECFGDLELFLITFAVFFSFRKFDQLLLLYRYGIERYRFKGRLVLFLTKLLAFKLGNRLICTTDSELISSEFKFHLKNKLFLLPIPHTHLLKPKQKSKNGKILCWWPGEPRPGKGLKQILSLVSTSDEASKKFKLLVAKSAPLPITIPNQIEIETVSDILPRQKYNEWLELSDIILLPYDSLLYRVGTSGIFVETIIAGKMPIAKEGNWISYELRKHNLSELILDWELPNPLSKILSLFKDPVIRGKLLKMQQYYSDFHCLDSFSKKLKELIIQIK